MRCGLPSPDGLTCVLERHEGDCAAIAGGVVVTWPQPRRPQTSDHVGVYWNRGKRKWQAQIKRGGRTIPLGRFETEAEAVAARQKAERTR